MPRKKFPKKPEGIALELEELCAHDDICTDLLIDRTKYHTQIRKCRTKYSPMRAIDDTQVIQIVQQHIRGEVDALTTVQTLLQLAPVRQYVGRLDTLTERDRFQEHMQTYLEIYSRDCHWEVTSTNRYTIGTYEAAVVARSRIEPGPIVGLTGRTVRLRDTESACVDDAGVGLSVMTSAKTGATYVMLGPARLVNHDCHPNAVLQPTSGGVQVVARRHIHRDEEITVCYGGHYFGTDNVDCLCASCEDLVQGGWRQPGRGGTSSAPAIPSYVDSRRVPSEYSLLRHILSLESPPKAESRQPADYVLTKKLLSGPYDRWTQCRNEACGHTFVQEDGYNLRWDCPRCERHRVLFDQPWPMVDMNTDRVNPDIVTVTNAARQVTQGKCGKGRWVCAETARIDGAPRVTTLFVPAAQRRQITRQGLQMEADVARLHGRDVGVKFQGNGQEVTRRSRRQMGRGSRTDMKRRRTQTTRKG